jgi:hypothetical protein
VSLIDIVEAGTVLTLISNEVIELFFAARAIIGENGERART